MCIMIYSVELIIRDVEHKLTQEMTSLRYFAMALTQALMITCVVSQKAGGFHGGGVDGVGISFKDVGMIQHPMKLRKDINVNRVKRAGQAVIADRTMYISGQIGLYVETGKRAKGGVVPETRQAMTNMRKILKAAGAGLNNDFPEIKSARAAYQSAALPLGAQVEIEAIAVVGDIVENDKTD